MENGYFKDRIDLAVYFVTLTSVSRYNLPFVLVQEYFYNFTDKLKKWQYSKNIAIFLLLCYTEFIEDEFSDINS